ncbi:hypothetical protein OG205_39060 [Lentzea sp. NBC_00516]|uniref:phenolic acid decarboxylase n=1 Tax=Lentzea sp. NBC_00516 TaxID=2903582 RepID=UPI002E80A553|nr:hypothetical protein [Lentzea sp. NBC_00516]WUD23996.1 hypothetical protein OG205_39060 [Lentzea sp. NBC_00516]
MTHSITEPSPHGRTFRYALPNGWSFLMHFGSDGDTLRMEGLTGEHVGQVADFDITVARIASGVHFISWIKPDGDSVSHVHDYNTNTVHAFWAAGQENGERIGRSTTGTIHEHLI